MEAIIVYIYIYIQDEQQPVCWGMPANVSQYRSISNNIFKTDRGMKISKFNSAFLYYIIRDNSF